MLASVPPLEAQQAPSLAAQQAQQAEWAQRAQQAQQAPWLTPALALLLELLLARLLARLLALLLALLLARQLAQQAPRGQEQVLRAVAAVTSAQRVALVGLLGGLQAPGATLLAALSAGPSVEAPFSEESRAAPAPMAAEPLQQAQGRWGARLEEVWARLAARAAQQARPKACPACSAHHLTVELLVHLLRCLTSKGAQLRPPYSSAATGTQLVAQEAPVAPLGSLVGLAPSCQRPAW